MTFVGPPRPASRWCHSATELDHFALITFAVETERLVRQVPAPFVPDAFTFDDGTTGSLVSAVPFLDRDFAFRFFPWIRISCGQVNYRAYGSLGGERGVWFFGTSLDSAFVALPRYAWQMPWHRDRIRITSTPVPGHEGDAAKPARIDIAITGEWGGAEAQLVATGTPLGRLDGFADADETIEVLTHPLVGWYPRARGGIGRYTVWHEVLRLELGHAESARFDVFERLDLVSPGTRPHSALLQDTVHFDVHTPPRRVSP